MEEVKENKSIVTSYRLKEDTKDKIKTQLDQMGLTQEQYFNKVVSMMELENVKQNNIFAINTTELQDLTQRIYNLFIGLCDQGNSFLGNKDTELEELKAKYKDMLFNKDNIITQIKDELQQVYNNLNVLQNENNNNKNELLNVKLEYNKQMEQLEGNLNDKTSLINEYKQKNDDLMGIISEYKQYKIEVEEYKKLLADAHAKNIDKDNIIKDNELNINGLNKDIEKLSQEHDAELENLKDKLIFEKDKSILELKQEQQQQLENLQDKYSNKINEYQNKYESLLKDMEKSKQNTHSKRPAGEGTSKGGTK